MNRDALIERLIDDEDLRLVVYDDATGKPLKPGDTIKGKPSIGIGRNLVDKGITKPEALMLCGGDIDEVEGNLDRYLPWWRQLSPNRQIVVASMCFNMGINKLQGFVNTLRMMKQGDYAGAAEGMLSSLWSKQVGERAQRLAKMMREG